MGLSRQAHKLFRMHFSPFHSQFNWLSCRDFNWLLRHELSLLVVPQNITCTQKATRRCYNPILQINCSQFGTNFDANDDVFKLYGSTPPSCVLIGSYTTITRGIHSGTNEVFVSNNPVLRHLSLFTLMFSALTSLFGPFYIFIYCSQSESGRDQWGKVVQPVPNQSPATSDCSWIHSRVRKTRWYSTRLWFCQSTSIAWLGTQLATLGSSITTVQSRHSTSILAFSNSTCKSAS